jgi:hypothetical protein
MTFMTLGAVTQRTAGEIRGGAKDVRQKKKKRGWQSTSSETTTKNKKKKKKKTDSNG